jgi:anti-sigma factor RsiW
VNHSRAQGFLSAYLEDDLSEADRSTVESHVAGCEVCSEDLRDLRSAVALLRRLPTPEPPPFLASRVMARIADGETRQGGWRHWLAQAGAPVIAASLAAAVAALAVFALATPPVEEVAQQIPAPRTLPGPLVPQVTGSVEFASERSGGAAPRLAERPATLPARAVLPDLLARQLRGAGHPYSAELARHFDGPSEAVAVSWTSR